MARFVDGDNVRVVELRDGPGLGQVGFGVLRAGDESAVRDLDGHKPVQAHVEGQVNDAERPLAEDLFHPVLADVGRRGGRLRPLVRGRRLGRQGRVVVAHGAALVSGVGKQAGLIRPDPDPCLRTPVP